MLGPWTPVAAFLVGFLMVLLLTRWITHHLQGLMFLLGTDEEVIMYLQFVVLFPGILVHESAHWLTAKLLGVRTLDFSVWPKRKTKGKVQYGAVRIAQTDIVRGSLIGLAPLVVASLLIIVIGRYALGTEALRQALASGQWGQAWGALSQSMRAADFWLWMYLIFAISNAMFPSESDREAWKPLLLYGAAIAVLLYLVGWKPPLESVQEAMARALNPLIYAFAVTAAVDFVFAVIIGLVEIIVGRLLGKRVVY